jgi:ribonuclease R
MKRRGRDRTGRKEGKGQRVHGSLQGADLLLTLHEIGVPVSLGELAGALRLGPEHMALLDELVERMVHEGTLLRNRRGAICVADKLDLLKGRVQGHADGFGFLLLDDGTADCFIGPRQMQKVMHGDRVMAREVGIDRRGRRDVAIVEVLERANTTVVGRLQQEHGIHFVEPAERRLTQRLLVAAEDLGQAKPGQIVVARILAQPTGNTQPVARVEEILGTYADPGLEIEIALRKHNLPHTFSRSATHLAEQYPREPGEVDFAGRVDLRDLPLVTIDGETARDFDDAVYCEPLQTTGGTAAAGKRRTTGYRLVVCIADVSHYVRPGDALDREARERGTSVYFPRRVIPMLPEALSNGLCSLNAEVNRLCVACDMVIGPRGAIRSHRFFPAVMRSRARLTYTQVAGYLTDGADPDKRFGGAVGENVRHLETLFRALLRERGRRGAIDFETIETELRFDQNGKIERIVAVARNDAHRIIEECMLAANVCASQFLRKHKHPALYRVHEGPTPERLEGLRTFLKEFGLELGGEDEPRAGDYAKLLASIKHRPDVQLLQTVLLRSLRQAVYSPENVGHFGLAYEAYTHFTSPIRRYPDLLVHRSIKAVLERRRYDPGSWVDLGVHCSQSERRADDATREVVSWLKCFYMQDRVGDRFEGSISAVTGFGIFVALDQVYVEGLVHISELGSDYYHFDATRHQLVGERTGRRFRLADRVKVRLVRVGLEQMKIDFVLDE